MVMRVTMIAAIGAASVAADCCTASPFDVPVQGCTDHAIEACVCAFDNYCCATMWDSQCVTEAKSTQCGMQCSVPCEGPAKPMCTEAEVQAPRDLMPGAVGMKPSKAAVLTVAQVARTPQTNIHFHLGAEHKSESYQDSTGAETYDAAHARRLETTHAAVRPGFMCKTDQLTQEQLTPYTFEHCKGEMMVGKTYEVHYVHSSAGTGNRDLADGLGNAAGGRGQLNPMVSVQAQVFLIVNDDIPEHQDLDLVHGWDHTNHTNAVMYAGSTTGTSHDNTVCSPYTITWHVDKDCHEISAAAFDNMCKDMKEMYNMESDLYPHGSRILLSEDFVVPADEVHELY